MDALTRPIYVIASVKQKAEHRWELEIEWHGEKLESKRTMESDSCMDLARAAALTTALAIDPNANPLAPANASVASNAESTVVVVPKMQPVQPKASGKPLARHGGSTRQGSRAGLSTASQDQARLDVSFSVAMQNGVLPHASPSLGLGVTPRFGAWGVHGEVGALLPASWENDDFRGKLWLAEILFGTCYAVEAGRLQIGPCLGGSWQHYWVRSERVGGAQRRTDGATAIRGGLGLMARYRLTPSLGVVGSAWVLAAAKWPTFLLRPETEVYAPEVAAFRLGLGIAYDVL